MEGTYITTYLPFTKVRTNCHPEENSDIWFHLLTSMRYAIRQKVVYWQFLLTDYLASYSGFHKILFNRVFEALTKPNSWGQWWECQARSKRWQIVQSKMYFNGLLDLVHWIYSSLALFLFRETTLSNLSSSNITQSTRSMSQHFFQK